MREQLIEMPVSARGAEPRFERLIPPTASICPRHYPRWTNSIVTVTTQPRCTGLTRVPTLSQLAKQRKEKSGKACLTSVGPWP